MRMFTVRELVDRLSQLEDQDSLVCVPAVDGESLAMPIDRIIVGDLVMPVCDRFTNVIAAAEPRACYVLVPHEIGWEISDADHPVTV